MLVTCNCKILKLYTAQRFHKTQKGEYSGLQDGEGGRYSVLSVTNPNYIPTEPTESNYSNEDKSLVKMKYLEDILVERSEACPNFIRRNKTDVITALPIAVLSKQPSPQSV